MEAAAVDLDLIYEMLDPSDSPKDDETTWRRARRASAKLAETLLAEGMRVVVVEGDFPHRLLAPSSLKPSTTLSEATS